MREIRPYGSVRGACGDARPYRDISGINGTDCTDRCQVVRSVRISFSLTQIFQ
jgi:hypothetical protein